MFADHRLWETYSIKNMILEDFEAVKNYVSRKFSITEIQDTNNIKKFRATNYNGSFVGEFENGKIILKNKDCKSFGSVGLVVNSFCANRKLRRMKKAINYSIK